MNCLQACSQANFPEGAKSFAMKSTRQGSNDGELLYPKYIGCETKRQRVQWDGGAIAGAVDGAIAPNAPDWLRAWVLHNFRRTQLPPSTEENISSLGTAVQHNFRRTLLVPSGEENISSLGAAVQHNFRRTLLLPSREENISSLSTAVQHNFRRTLLVPSGEPSGTC